MICKSQKQYDKGGIIGENNTQGEVRKSGDSSGSQWDMDTSQVILVMKQNQKEGRPITEPRPYEEPELTDEMVNDPNYLYDYSNENREQ